MEAYLRGAVPNQSQCLEYLCNGSSSCEQIVEILDFVSGLSTLRQVHTEAANLPLHGNRSRQSDYLGIEVVEACLQVPAQHTYSGYNLKRHCLRVYVAPLGCLSLPHRCAVVG